MTSSSMTSISICWSRTSCARPTQKWLPQEWWVLILSPYLSFCVLSLLCLFILSSVKYNNNVSLIPFINTGTVYNVCIIDLCSVIFSCEWKLHSANMHSLFALRAVALWLDLLFFLSAITVWLHIIQVLEQVLQWVTALYSLQCIWFFLYVDHSTLK